MTTNKDEQDFVPLQRGDHVLYFDGEQIRDALVGHIKDNGVIDILWIPDIEPMTLTPGFDVPHGKLPDKPCWITQYEADNP